MFIGRSAELKLLEGAYRSPRTEFIPIYGRRRVGKSELILRFFRDHPGLYILGKKAPPQLQIKSFLQEAARALDQPLLASLAVPDWQTAIATVLKQRPTNRKFVLVLDEFQWMAQASPELPSVLQELLDRTWKQEGNVLLILCGSYVGFMEKEVLGQKSPLFGRRTAQVLLRPFSFREAALFHPTWSLQHRAQAYFICGGIPLYLQCFSPQGSIRNNIQNNLLSEFAPLYREPDSLLREELREVESYFGILIALSSGARTPAAIAAHTGIAERSLHYYLQQLSELGYVSRQHPLSGSRPTARRVRFSLEDPVLRFWFRFIYPQAGSVARMGPDRAFRELVQPGLDSYFGACFERLCREALPVLYDAEGVSAPFEVGEYWDKHVQIDVVGQRQDGRVDIGECKWGVVGSMPALVREVTDKMTRYPNRAGATLHGRIFTRQCPRSASLPANVSLHVLDDLYAEG